MGIPTSPETIILKNKYYPGGLREKDIWEYYQKVKRELIAVNVGHQMMVYIMTALNKSIIRRYGSDNKPIYLDNKSYENVVTGRTISFHASMNPSTRYGIIDVDVHPSDSFLDAKRATFNVYDYIMDKIPFIRTTQIRYTGKSSFHIVCDFGRIMRADTVRFMLEKFLRQSPLSKVYTISAKKASWGVQNIDLNRNAFKANHISLYSLSVWGLRCMEVPYNKLMSFNQREAILR